MATLAANVVTLADWAKRRDPDGSAATVVEMLQQTNPILEDMHWEEGNLPTGHRVTVRTGLPSVGWRLLNQGITPSKSTTAQVDEACGMLESWSEVDKDLVELANDQAAFRLSEASAFLEAMNQEMAATLFYGNAAAAPEEFNGLATRYSSIASSVAYANNMLTGSGGSSDNCSIWLTVWGPQTMFGVFPQGSKAGIQHEDLGLQTIETASTPGIGATNGRLRAYQDHWQWKCGLVVRDWRYAVRIANIDLSNLQAKSSAADLFDLMIKAQHRIPNLSAGQPVYYMNRAVYEMFDIQTRDDVISGAGLTYQNAAGQMIPSFRGIPMRKCDQLLTSESTLS